MASRGVAVLKFVGTVSLGLLTGLSFTLSTVTVPTLLTLPSARTAAQAFRSLTDAATRQLRALAGVAGSAFFLAFLFSPRAVRHPYLLYTSLLVLGGRAVASDALAPYLFAAPAPAGDAAGDPFAASSSSPSSSSLSPPSSPSRRRGGGGGGPPGFSPAHMEASYEVLGSATAGSAGSVSGGSVSDSHSDGGAGSDAAAAAAAGGSSPPAINGEEVRAAVEVFLKKQIVRTVLSGTAFAMAVVGLWGDGVAPVWPSETLIVV